MFSLTESNRFSCIGYTVMYTMMGCCKLAGVNVEGWLTYFLDHIHEYDSDYSKDLADFLPANLMANGILKESETL